MLFKIGGCFNAISEKMSGKRRMLTLKEKIDIVKTYDKKKLNVRNLSKRFNIGKTQAAVKRNFIKPMGLNIDKFCYDWFVKARNKGIPLSGPLIRAKTKDIAQTLEYKNFSVSSRWLEKFRKRRNITFKVFISGEAESVNSGDVKSFLNKMTSLIKDYSSKNIFNADETDLFFRALPDKTLTFKREKCTGGKLSKERLTILHCVNMNGEKERLLVIGKSKNRRAFKNINVNNLPVVWKSNRKAWMTSAIMAEWLKDFDRRIGAERRKILLFLKMRVLIPKTFN
ncbi:tigger transposable element-derived protein 6-like [Euwallacea similis]|uniref:tigger transposable element-derived protein 6-like n=1 Tax=Euwallacea similis TaxID=1736056 RepID=UPI00345019FB